ncbi:hypothetical protein QOT17_014036 [Balamuthia mandrillaris]
MSSHHFSLVFICFVLCFFVNASLGQSCATWNGEPSICAQSPQYQPGMQFYVPPGWTAEEMIEQLVGATSATFSFVATNSEELFVCQMASIAGLCSSWLRPCDNTSFPITVPVQQCSTVCEALWKECLQFAEMADAVDQVGLAWYRPEGHPLPLVCETAYELYGQDNVSRPLFETPEYNVTIGNQTKSFSCYNQTKYSGYLVTQCPDPMQVFMDGVFPRCFFVCPFPYYEEENYDALNIIQVVLGWLSLISTAVTFILFALNPMLRKFPINMLFFLLLSLHILSWGMVMPSLASDGKEGIWCGGEDQPYDELTEKENMKIEKDENGKDVYFSELIMGDNAVAKNTACSIQGGIIYFGILSATVWWCLVGFNTGFSVLLLLLGRFEEMEQKTWFQRTKMGVFFFLGVILPLILSISLFTADAFGFMYSSAFCFITDEEDKAFLIAFWFAPSGFMLLICLTCTIFTVFHLVRTAMKQGGKLLLRTVPNLSRIIAFMLVFLVCYVFIFSYDIHLARNSEAINEETQKYVNCLLWPFGGNAGKECQFDEELAGFPGAVIKSLAFSSLGLLTSLALLCNQGPWTFVLRSVSHVVTKGTSSKSDLKMTITAE